jgi:hypothetical protein
MKKIYTIENVTQEALKYDNKTDFYTFSSKYYEAAKSLKILKEVCSHMPKRMVYNKKWTKKVLIEAAQKFDNRKDFCKHNWPAYRSASIQGLLDEICSHMDRIRVPSNYWTKERLQEEALKYSTKAEFHKNSPQACNAAYGKGLIDEICQHMASIWEIKWDDPEKIKLEALKYNTRTDFIQNASGAYAAATDLNILDEVCSHMKLGRTSSKDEIVLFEIVKQKFPNTKKLRHRHIAIENKPHITGFDVDIYIPDLNKGIEFDGNYWHSPENLRKGRKHWPLEDVQNYHQIKDEYFKSKGIELLHIKEFDWKNNNLQCIQQVNEFLGVL